MRRTIENAQSGDTQKSIDSQNATIGKGREGGADVLVRALGG